MTNRKILYGYQIHDGALAIVPEEQQVVRMVFTLYNAGASYQNISDALNRQNIPFSPRSIALEQAQGKAGPRKHPLHR